ncbi:hypothetical protein Bca101_017937 [Brassica carinata]
MNHIISLPYLSTLSLQRPKSDLTFSSGPAPRECASGTGGAPSSSLSFSFCFLSCRVRSLRLARLLWVCVRSPVSFLCASRVVPVWFPSLSRGLFRAWETALHLEIWLVELGVQEELAPSSVQFCVRPLALTGLGFLCIIVQSIPSDTGGGFLQRSLGSWFSVLVGSLAAVRLDFLCRFLETFSLGGGEDNNPLFLVCGDLELQASRRSSETSYSGDDLGSPGIRGNEENLTFPRSLSMVENGNRFLRISKIGLVERAGFSGWAKLECNRLTWELLFKSCL